MKPVLLLLTGGTICSFVSRDGDLLVNHLDSQKAKTLIVDYLRRDCPQYRDIEFDVRQPLDIFSENMTLETLSILTSFLKTVDWHKYSGVIILHGTDTLAFTSSLLSFLLAGAPLPTFLVSSNFSIARDEQNRCLDPRSNGSANFQEAVRLIAGGIRPDVYVPYRNMDDHTMYLHKGNHLLQCAIYDNDFHSEDAVKMGNGNFPQFPAGNVTPENKMLIHGFPGFHKKILSISPYVGMDYHSFRLDGFSAVLHTTYHAGTACVERTAEKRAYSESSILSLLDRCRERDLDVWCLPCAKMETGAQMYSTVPFMINHDVFGNDRKGIRPIYGVTYEAAYAKLLVAHNLNMTSERIHAFMESEVCGEIAY